jgi:ubiquinone/menaquinone biosynthesis C-methylase UbiE
MDRHTCPWWLAYSFDNPLRRLIHDPARILGGMVYEGQTAVDIGCGFGYFSLALARLVGPHGHVIGIDLQPEMLERAEGRARHRGLGGRIEFRQCEPGRLGLRDRVDFALAFWMVHEVADREVFLTEVRSALNPRGHFLLVEPKVHVPAPRFRETVDLASASGFEVLETPRIGLSRAVLFGPGELQP